MINLIKKPLAAVGIAAGSFGLAFGIGMAVSQAATTNASSASTTAASTATTSPASTSHPCPSTGSTSAT